MMDIEIMGKENNRYIEHNKAFDSLKSIRKSISFLIKFNKFNILQC